jgi:hypothetical protein
MTKRALITAAMQLEQVRSTGYSFNLMMLRFRGAGRR